MPEILSTSAVPQHYRVVDHFHRRLLAAVTRSPLLKATVSRTGRLLDCARLESVEPGLADRVVRNAIDGGGTVSLQLTLRESANEPRPDTTLAEDENEDVGSERPESQLVREHKAIYDTLDRRVRSYAELVRRETGVSSLRLGYPLLYVPVGESDSTQWILAPIFLWHVTVKTDRLHEGKIEIQRDKDFKLPTFNRALGAWVQRQLSIQLVEPSQSELEQLTWEKLRPMLQSMATQFEGVPVVDFDGPLKRVPEVASLNGTRSPRFFNAGVLGIFRWQNEAIVADLEELKNREQIDGVAAGFTSGIELDKSPPVPRPPEEDRYQVYDADFSQEKVIWRSRSAPGLVVHGPPGTGKSQTIVNIIADALAHHRTVLMVCQKQAATRIVYEKLKQVGLDDLCLEVLDSERSRRPVFRAIRDQVEALLPNDVQMPVTTRAQVAQKISRLEGELDKYSSAMHEVNTKFGLTYGQVKIKEGETYASFPAVRPLPGLQAQARNWSWPQLDALVHDIEEAGRTFGLAQPLTNPWRFHVPNILLTPVLNDDVASAIQRLVAQNDKHVNQIQMDGPGGDIIGDFAQFATVLKELVATLRLVIENLESTSTALLRAWLVRLRELPQEQWPSEEGVCARSISLCRKIAAAPLDDDLKARLQDVPAQQLKTLFGYARTVVRFQKSWWRFFSLRYREASAALRDYDTAEEANPHRAAQTLLDYEKGLALRTQLIRLHKKQFPSLCPADAERDQTRFSKAMKKAFEMAVQLSSLQHELPWVMHFIEALLTNQPLPVLEEHLRVPEQTLSRLPAATALFQELQHLAAFLTSEGIGEPETLVAQGKSIAPWLEGLTAGFRGLQSLLTIKLMAHRDEEPVSSILAELQAYESRLHRGDNVPAPPSHILPQNRGEWWVAIVKYTALSAWQEEYHRQHPILVTMTPARYAEKVNELGKRLVDKRELEVPAIRAVWSQYQTNHRAEPWRRMFQLQNSRNGNAKRLREAVELSLPRGLLEMRPCWLVNPGTAAELFPLTAGLFDVVIFDESSQCPIEQAIPSIYRGKTVIICGDEKQMPPSSIFASSIDDIAQENGDEVATDQPVAGGTQRRQLGVEFLLNVEDVLGAAIETLPEEMLTVHYRSKHPALIEFSNRAFYSGRLESPPPQAMTDPLYRPIRYVEVNGVYRDRTNNDEAKRVVQVLRDYWRTGISSPSVGVVTFNAPQRDLIEELLAKECVRDDAFEAAYQRELARQEDNQDIGFFVKNLENVQGDERDVIIFSTTFGRNENGQFFRKFGPVGTDKGERRLNVAVTRAKQEVVIVGSMPINEISQALQALGVPGGGLTPRCYLQLYLAYAKAISEGDGTRVQVILDRLLHYGTPTTLIGAESPFEDDVEKAIRGLGFEVRNQVGDSGFRIDLGILAPDPHRGYIVGVECDGATYHSGRSARLRDVWRENILRSRGWNIHRIWSTRWWYHRQEEIDRLQSVLDGAVSQLQLQPAPVNLRRPWEMTLQEWTTARNELRSRGDIEGLRAIGGLTTDYAHRYQVTQAVRDGKHVPQAVLDNYPGLANVLFDGDNE